MTNQGPIDLEEIIRTSGSAELKRAFEEMVRLELEWVETGDESSFARWQELTQFVHGALEVRDVSPR